MSGQYVGAVVRCAACTPTPGSGRSPPTRRVGIQAWPEAGRSRTCRRASGRCPRAASRPPRYRPRVGFRTKSAPQYPLAATKARYAGEPVAVLVATDRYLAEDALDLIRTRYDPLPAVVDVETALGGGAPLVHDEWGDNVALDFHYAIGDVERAFAG